MINNDRIVPIQRTDFLSLISVILGIAGVTFTTIHSDVEGHFAIAGSSDAGNMLADQPVKALDFASATAGVVYCVFDFGFEGFKAAGAAVEAEGEFKTDGITLYKVTLSSGDITVAAV